MQTRFMSWVPDAATWTAWRQHVRTATTTPWLWRELTERSAELFPRFAERYRQLRSLPRRMRRQLQRQWACSLAGIALAMVLNPSASWAANFTASNDTELIAAINAANANPDADIITLTNDITLTAVNNGSSSYANGLPNGLPIINSAMTIEGQAHTIARQSSQSFRLFQVNPAGALTIDAVTLTGGNRWAIDNQGQLTLINSTVSGNGRAALLNRETRSSRPTMTIRNSTISNNGSYGVENNGGDMTITNSTLTNNRYGVNHRTSYSAPNITITDSTISGNSFFGMRISGGTAVVSNSTITANDRDGVFVDGGDVTLTRSKVSNNGSTGIAQQSGTLTIDSSTIANNGGRGVQDLHGGTRVTITSSTISGNHAGGIFSLGGGSFSSGSLTVMNSTVSGNSAGDGGGIWTLGKLTLRNSTVTGNTATGQGGGVFNGASQFGGGGIVDLQNSLVSGNQAPSGAEIHNQSVTYDYSAYGGGVYTFSGTIITHASTILGHSGNAGVEGFTLSPTDLVPAVPLNEILNPILADNGGPTLTHTLVPGSPAIDAGNNTLAVDATGAPLTTDQRGVGFPRIDGCDATPTVDIGAIELLPICNNPPIAHCQNVTVSTSLNTCAAASASINNGSSDPDNNPLTLTQSPVGPYPVGTTFVELTVSDGTDSSQCKGTITVVDGQAPTLTCPGNQTATATNSSGTLVSFPLTATDNCGTVIPSCTPASGASFAPGSTSVTCTATDGAGLQASCSFSVQVNYAFTGFFQPVDNPPVINEIKAGKSLQVKFSLGGNFGLAILGANSPSSQAVACQAGDPVDIIEEETTSNSGLTYDATTNQYKYAWKTDKAWAGTCRQLKVTLADGSEHTALFMFK